MSSSSIRPCFGDVDRLRRPDQRDDLVERVERLDQTAQDVGALVGLAQPVGGAPHDDVELMVDVVPDQLVEPQRAGHAVDDRQHVGAEAGLQLGVLVEVVQHHLGHGVALELDDDAHADAVTALVLDVGDAVELAVADLLGDRGDEVVVVDLIRQLGDDDAGPAAVVFFDLDYAAHPDRPAAGRVGVVDPLRANDQTVGGEVGALDALGDRGQRGLFVGVMVFQAPVHRFGELAQVVRRHVGGHADGDTARAVGEQVGEPARQDGRLLHTAVVVRDEIDCLLVDFTQHLHRQRREPRFRVVADEAVGDEGVVGGVHPQAVHRLHAGIGHRRDARVVETAVGQLRRDRADIGIGDAAEDLGAIALPSGQPVDVVLAQPFFVDPATTAVLADEVGQTRNVIAVQARGRLGQRCQNARAASSCLRPPKPTCVANNSAWARLVMTTLYSPTSRAGSGARSHRIPAASAGRPSPAVRYRVSRRSESCCAATQNRTVTFEQSL